MTDPAAPFNAMVKARHGYLIYNENDQFVGRSVATYGEWCEMELRLLLAVVSPGDTVIEVGANIGTHTVPLARAVGESGRIIAYEPQRLVHQTLCGNLAINSLTNVTVHRQAVGAVCGTTFIPEPDPRRAQNFGGVQVSETGDEVPLVTLDESFSGESLRLIKVDAEEMEIPVLMGAQKLIARHRPLLFLENNIESGRRAELNASVMALGYDAYWHVSALYNPYNAFKKTENIFPGCGSFNILCAPAGTALDLPLFQLVRITDPAAAPPTGG